MVKLHDETDTTSHRYYAAGSLHKAYNNHTLRKHPSEKFVSGETGSPLMDQAIQSEDTQHLPLDSGSSEQKVISEEHNSQFFGESSKESVVQGSFNAAQSDSNDSSPVFRHINDSVPDSMSPQDSPITPATTEEHPLPVHLSVSNEPPDDIETGGLAGGLTDGSTGGLGGLPANQKESQVHETGATDDGDDLLEHVLVKIEKVDPDDDEPSYTETSGDAALPENFEDVGSGDVSMQTEMLPPHDDGGLQQTGFTMSPKPYQCGLCQKAFSSVQVLQKHTQTFHQLRRPGMMSSSRTGKGHMMVRQNTSKR